MLRLCNACSWKLGPELKLNQCSVSATRQHALTRLASSCGCDSQNHSAVQLAVSNLSAGCEAFQRSRSRESQGADGLPASLAAGHQGIGWTVVIILAGGAAAGFPRLLRPPARRLTFGGFAPFAVEQRLVRFHTLVEVDTSTSQKQPHDVCGSHQRHVERQLVSLRRRQEDSFQRVCPRLLCQRPAGQVLAGAPGSQPTEPLGAQVPRARAGERSHPSSSSQRQSANDKRTSREGSYRCSLVFEQTLVVLVEHNRLVYILHNRLVYT